LIENEIIATIPKGVKCMTKKDFLWPVF